MTDLKIALLLAALAGGCVWMFAEPSAKTPEPLPAPSPCPPDKPCPMPCPKPDPKPKRPWGDCGAPVGAKRGCGCCEHCNCPERACPCRVMGRKCSSCCQCSPRYELRGLIEAKVGGPVSPDGVEIQCDLPGERHKANVTSRGQGCCVQTSIGMSADWQNVPALVDFQKWVQQKGLPGGAYPGAVDQRIPACAKDRGFPVPDYVQVEGKDVEILKLALRTGRMPMVTYSKSPTGRYNGSRIAHAVNMAHGDENYVAILDNNYVGTYEWQTWDEYMRIANLGGPYWAVILLNAPPPAPPRN